eukprot:scaffold650_cov407-Prasinococcus_capsulatus_cf.AAC.45
MARRPRPPLTSRASRAPGNPVPSRVTPPCGSGDSEGRRDAATTTTMTPASLARGAALARRGAARAGRGGRAEARAQPPPRSRRLLSSPRLSSPRRERTPSPRAATRSGRSKGSRRKQRAHDDAAAGVRAKSPKSARPCPRPAVQVGAFFLADHDASS